MKIRQSIILLLLLFLSGLTPLKGQDRSEIVSKSRAALAAAQNDSVRVFHLNKIAWNISYSDLDSGLYYVEKAIDLAISANQRKQLGIIYNTKATILQDMGKLSLSAEFYEKAIEVDKEINDENALSTSYSNYSNLEMMRGNYQKARDLMFHALKFFTKSDNQRGMAMVMSNLGISYSEENILDSALFYLEKSDEIARKKLLSEIYVANLTLLARVHYKMGKKNLAFQEIEDAWKMVQIKKSPYESVQVESEYGEILLEDGQFSKSMTFLSSALVKAEQVGMRETQMRIHQSLSKAYEGLGQFAQALDAHKKYAQLKEELNEESAAEKLNHLSFKLESERKSREIEDLQQQAKIRKLDQEKKEQQIKSQGMVILFGALAFGLVLVLIFFLFRSNKRKQKINALLNHQKHEIEHKNKEITDSITYARRIQNAILPSEQFIHSVLPNSFILYLPKDIVAGDFYWLKKKDENVLFAVCDCTGHGVPGAMVSVVCHNALESASNESGINEPGKLLDEVRSMVTTTFSAKQSEVRDGMDVSIGFLNPNTHELLWSGANNPLWIIRKSDRSTIEEWKGLKQSIGKTDQPIEFPTHSIILEKGDRLYLFSDGFADQFGGKEGKKFKSSNLKKLILSLQSKPLREHTAELHAAFDQWKADLEQVDDICLMGIEIS